jgi:DeoR family fructose operon transcriptional repressor
LAVEAFSKIRADVAIMSCGGITAEGITNSHGLLIEIQRAMINAARRVIFCIDSTKFGRQSISKLCNLDIIDVVVTDPAAPEPFLELLRKLKVHVVIASGEEVEPMPAIPAATPRELEAASRVSEDEDAMPVHVL